MYYVLSQSNGQFFFHDGDRRIPILTDSGNTSQNAGDYHSYTACSYFDTTKAFLGIEPVYFVLCTF